MQKSICLRPCSTFGINKKRDRNLAVPHSEALVLPSNPNNNTEAHAVCINARIIRAHYLHTYGHLVLQCFGLYEFTRFRNAKTKRVRRLFNMSCIYPHPEWHIPSAWAKYCKTFVLRRKSTTYFLSYAKNLLILSQFYLKPKFRLLGVLVFWMFPVINDNKYRTKEPKEIKLR